MFYISIKGFSVRYEIEISKQYDIIAYIASVITENPEVGILDVAGNNLNDSEL